MWEARKQIIELIEPYLDKSLSEGCYVKTKEYWALFQIIDSVDNYMFLDDNLKVIDIDYRWEWQTTIKDYKILWHYDISAVLKYIEDTEEYDNNPKTYICKTVIHLYEMWVEIPNKPLHLYTEDEEKNLLQLLKKLWNK